MGVITYKEGSKGAVVTLIQKAVGCYPDGIWGRLTTEAVKNYQKEHGLTADGIAGPKTLTAMGISVVTSPKVSASLDSVVSSYGGKTIRLKRSKRRIDYIAIHCTASQEGRDMTVEDIRRQHKAQGWSDCGYHYVIYRDGTVNIGRDVDISGAHVSGYNSNSIGISYVGGLESRPGVPYSMLKAKDTRTDAQKASLLSLLMDLRKLYPKAKIQGHRDFSPDKNHDGVITPDEWLKDCPSFDAKFTYRNV